MSLESSDYENLIPGATIFDNYRILRCLGKGSTSVVYACRVLEEYELLAAVKILSKEAAKDSRIATRFRNEIRMSHRVNHPNVIHCIEYLKNDSAEAFSMELAEGGSLHDLMFNQGALDLRQSLRILLQLCKAVQAIHNAGIVHRDLTPRNILMTLQHDVKVADFSTAVCPKAGPMPFDIGRVGTFEYMSPEVLKYGVSDVRSDIFGLGVIGYQMITGELPFKSINFVARDEPERRSKPIPPRKLRPQCPKSLNKVLLKALMVKPHKRFQSANEMLEALQSVQQEINNPRKSTLARLFMGRVA